MKAKFKLLLVTLAMLLLCPAVFAADAAPVIDKGDTAWILISSALVMLMTPGLALFYSGMVRKKNILGTLMQSFASLIVVTIVWMLWATVWHFPLIPE